MDGSSRQWAAAELPCRVDRWRTCAVAPLEALRVPPSLDGSKGTNRANTSASCLFDNDVRAIGAWLDARSSSEHTRRAYRREAEWLLLWSLLEKHKPLSSLDNGDCGEYIGTFLLDPQPAAALDCARARGALPVELASFCRPAFGSQPGRTARSILSAMCEWLASAQYLASNPFAGLARTSTPAAFESAGRTLDKDLWAFVLESTVRDSYSFAEHRDRLALLLAYATRLRRGELAEASTGALSVGDLPGMAGPVWRFSVGARSILLPSGCHRHAARQSHQARLPRSPRMPRVDADFGSNPQRRSTFGRWRRQAVQTDFFECRRVTGGSLSRRRRAPEASQHALAAPYALGASIGSRRRIARCGHRPGPRKSCDDCPLHSERRCRPAFGA